MSNENRPKSLKDFLGENDPNSNKEKSLDEILNLDAKEHAEEKANTAVANAKVRNKIVLGAVALVVVIGGLLLINPWTGFDVLGLKADPPRLEAANAPQKQGDEPGPWYEDGNANTTPIKVPEWAKTLATSDASKLGDQQEADARKALAGTRLLGIVNTGLSSEDSGYTSKVSELIGKDGKLNLNFSYVTSDIFVKQSNDITTRLLNPTYGGWTQFQYSDSRAKTSFDPKIFSAVTSRGYQKKYFSKSDRSYLPVFADWASDDYGLAGTLVPKGTRWVGRIKDADVKLSYNEGNLNYDMSATYKVQFSAFTVDKKTITKNGVLKIKYITDRLGAGDDSLFRIKIDEANLSVS